MSSMTGGVGAVLARVPRRALVGLALAVAVGGGTAIWLLSHGGGPSRASMSFATANRGDVVVSVSSVGQIVEARAPTQPAAAAGGGAPAALTAAPAGAAASAPADTVFPRASGYVVRLLVVPGQHVAAGQPVALLDDGGSAAAATAQAQADFTAARIALSQSSTGVPASAEALAAAELAVQAAREKLTAVVSAPSRSAAITQARLDLANARLAAENLRHAPTVPTQTALAAAKLAVTLAEQKLGAAYQPASQTALLAAQAAVADAQAKLNALVTPVQGPLPSELSAAELAITLAQQQLAALVNPTPVDRTAAQLAVAQAQAALDKLREAPPPPDPAAVTAAQQALTLANANLAALSAPVPTAASVTAAQRDLHAANAALATLENSSTPPDPAALGAAQQAVASASQQLSALIASPQLATLTQARVDLLNARNAYDALRHGTTPTRTAAAAAQLAVKLARAKLAGLAAGAGRVPVTQARLDLATALAGLEALRKRAAPAGTAAVDIARLKLEAVRARLASARLAERQLTVRTSAAGTVTAVFAAPGTRVDPSTAVATLADLQHLAASVDLSEFDIARVRRGLPAQVSVDAFGGKSLPGKVLFVGATGASSASGAVTFPTLIGLARLAGLKIGMTVSARIIVARRRNVVRLPLDAVTGVGGGHATVTVLAPSGRTSSRRVELGLANNTYVEIASGLRAGERVVLAASQP